MKRKAVWSGAVKKKEKVLDPLIWTSTPKDIHHLLLSLLPLTSLCRFRCASKSWRRMIATIVPTSRRPWHISMSMIGSRLRIFYGSKRRRFGKVPLPPEIQGQDLKDLRCLRVQLVSTSAGLVLVIHGADLARTCWLSVHNPLVPSCTKVLGRLREIPNYQHCSLAFAGIQAFPSTASSGGKISFAVVCITDGRQGVMVHVFDSRCWSWVVGARIPGLGSHSEGEPALYQMDICYPCFNNILLQDERLYFCSVTSNDTRSLMCAGIWDPEHSCTTLATWTHLPLDLHQNPYTDFKDFKNPSLIFCQGKVMLVNIIPCSPHGAVGFLYLDEESRSWRALRSIPLDVFPSKVRSSSIKEDLTTAIFAAGIPGQSSKVALFFAQAYWGCIFDLDDSTWRVATRGTGTMIFPFHPSFLTF